MFVHQLAGFEDTRPETSSKPLSPSQFMSEPLAGLSKQCLKLISWESLGKDVDQLREQRDVGARQQLLDLSRATCRESAAADADLYKASPP